jgi:hypothetical protein
VRVVCVCVCVCGVCVRLRAPPRKKWKRSAYTLGGADGWPEAGVEAKQAHAHGDPTHHEVRPCETTDHAVDQLCKAQHLGSTKEQEGAEMENIK